MNPCIIIGNGPSLRNVSNVTLEKYPSFGSNGILLRFQPTYYVAVNPLAIRKFAPLIEISTSQKYLAAGTGDFTVNSSLTSTNAPLFSYDPLRYVYEGHTVTFVCLQLAFFFGFDTVYLFGVDHRYSFQGQPNEKNVWKGPDPNHFDPTYFQDAEWHNPDLERSEYAYNLAKHAFEADGRQIINCTEGSALKVFEMGAML